MSPNEIISIVIFLLVKDFFSTSYILALEFEKVKVRDHKSNPYFTINFHQYHNIVEDSSILHGTHHRLRFGQSAQNNFLKLVYRNQKPSMRRALCMKKYPVSKGGQPSSVASTVPFSAIRRFLNASRLFS